MELKEAIETMKAHNEWRRGAETEMVNPKDLGVAIDVLVGHAEQSLPSGGKSAEDVGAACNKAWEKVHNELYRTGGVNPFAYKLGFLDGNQYAHQQPVQGYSREQMEKGLYDALNQGYYSFLHPDICPPVEETKWVEQYILSIKQPVNDGWVRVDSGELPDYRLVVDVYKSHHNVVEPAARLSTDITGEKWSCEYGHYITHWRLRTEPPKQTV